jgi:regulator of replication initiation timing
MYREILLLKGQYHLKNVACSILNNNTVLSINNQHIRQKMHLIHFIACIINSYMFRHQCAIHRELQNKGTHICIITNAVVY